MRSPVRGPAELGVPRYARPEISPVRPEAPTRAPSPSSPPIVAIPAELFVSSPRALEPNAAPPAELAHLLVRVAAAEAEVQGLVGREQQLQVRLLAARDVKLEQALKDTVEATAKARRQLQTYEDAVAEQTFLLGAEDVRSC